MGRSHPDERPGSRHARDDAERGQRDEITRQWEILESTLYGPDTSGAVGPRPKWIVASRKALHLVGLPPYDAEDLVQETAAHLESWLQQEGPFPDLHPERLVNFTMHKRARGLPKRRRKSQRPASTT